MKCTYKTHRNTQHASQQLTAASRGNNTREERQLTEIKNAEATSKSKTVTTKLRELQQTADDKLRELVHVYTVHVTHTHTHNAEEQLTGT